MKSHFRHIALVGKYQFTPSSAPTSSSADILEHVAQFLYTQGCEVAIEKNTALNSAMTTHTVMDIEQIGKSCDLALVVGGDGTMLGFGRQLAPFDVPLIGINQGRLGFITDIALNHIESTLTPILQGAFEEDRRAVLQAQVFRGGSCVFDALAMNDVVVHRGSTAGLVELKIEVDSHFVAQQRADGLIIATPTGSTAYALSAGGPLLYPSLEGLLLVPIAPHTLSNRPLVLSNPGEIVIELVSGRDASVNFDMQSLASLLIGDRVRVRRSPHNVRFLHPKGWSFFDTIREKLHWNEDAT
jgi:NAD+ kinase